MPDPFRASFQKIFSRKKSLTFQVRLTLNSPLNGKRERNFFLFFFSPDRFQQTMGTKTVGFNYRNQRIVNLKFDFSLVKTEFGGFRSRLDLEPKDAATCAFRTNANLRMFSPINHFSFVKKNCFFFQNLFITRHIRFNSKILTLNAPESFYNLNKEKDT